MFILRPFACHHNCLPIVLFQSAAPPLYGYWRRSVSLAQSCICSFTGYWYVFWPLSFPPLHCLPLGGGYLLMPPATSTPSHFFFSIFLLLFLLLCFVVFSWHLSCLSWSVSCFPSFHCSFFISLSSTYCLCIDSWLSLMFGCDIVGFSHSGVCFLPLRSWV